MGLVADWQSAKKKFETATGKRKPSAKLAGVFAKGAGLQSSLKSMEQASTFDAMGSAVKKFNKAKLDFNALCLKALEKEKKTDEYKSELRTLMAALDEIADKAMVLEPLGVVDQPIFDEDITAQVIAGASNKQPVQPKNLKIKASVKMDKRILKEFEANPRLRQQFIDTPAGLRKPTIEALAKKLTECNTAAQRAAIGMDKSGVARAEKDFDTFAKRELDRLAEQTEKAVLKAWNDFVNVNSAYKNYKIKVVCNMTVGALVLTGSVLLVASGPTTGAGFIFGIFGICKQSVALLGEIVKAFIDAETWQKKLHADFKQYLAIVKGAKSGTAYELVGKVLSSQTGGVLGQWTVPTLSAIESNNKTFKSKLDGVEVKVNRFARKVEDNLKSQDKLKKERDETANWIAAAKAFARGTPIAAEIGKKEALLDAMDKTLGKYEDGLAALLKSVDKMNDCLEVGRNAHAAFDLAIGELKARNIKAKTLVKYLDLAIAVADMGAGAGIAGGSGGFESWDKAARPILITVLKSEKAAWTELLKRA